MKTTAAGLRSKVTVEALRKNGENGGPLYRVIVRDNRLDRSSVCAALSEHEEVLSVLPSTDERCFVIELRSGSDPAILHRVQDMVIEL